MGRPGETSRILQKADEYLVLHAAHRKRYPLAIRRIAEHCQCSHVHFYDASDAPMMLWVQKLEDLQDAEGQAAGKTRTRKRRTPPGPGAAQPTFALDELPGAAQAAGAAPGPASGAPAAGPRPTMAEMRACAEGRSAAEQCNDDQLGSRIARRTEESAARAIAYAAQAKKASNDLDQAGVVLAQLDRLIVVLRGLADDMRPYIAERRERQRTRNLAEDAAAEVVA